MQQRLNYKRRNSLKKAFPITKNFRSQHPAAHGTSSQTNKNFLDFQQNTPTTIITFCLGLLFIFALIPTMDWYQALLFLSAKGFVGKALIFFLCYTTGLGLFLLSVVLYNDPKILPTILYSVALFFLLKLSVDTPLGIAPYTFYEKNLVLKILYNNYEYYCFLGTVLLQYLLCAIMYNIFHKRNYTRLLGLTAIVQFSLIFSSTCLNVIPMHYLKLLEVSENLNSIPLKKIVYICDRLDIIGSNMYILSIGVFSLMLIDTFVIDLTYQKINNISTSLQNFYEQHKVVLKVFVTVFAIVLLCFAIFYVKQEITIQDLKHTVELLEDRNLELETELTKKKVNDKPTTKWTTLLIGLLILLLGK